MKTENKRTVGNIMKTWKNLGVFVEVGKLETNCPHLSSWMCFTPLSSGDKHLAACDLIIYRILFSGQAGSCNRNVLKIVTH